MDWRRPIRPFVPDFLQRVEFVYRQNPDLVDRFGWWSGGRVIWSLAKCRPVKIPGLPVRLPFDDAVRFHIRESTSKVERLASFVEPGDLVFDLGAHAGLFSVLAAKRGSRVVAVEPDPDTARLLRRNTRWRKVSVVEAAVSTKGGAEETFWRVATSTQTSSLNRPAAEVFGSADPITVTAVTFDHLVEEFGMPDIVKMDIQGSESELVPMMPLDDIRVLLIEVSDLDPGMTQLREELTHQFGEPVEVNSVQGGADLAFTR